MDSIRMDGLPTVVLVTGARPNFIKAAPLWRQLKSHLGIATRLIHTGQHYDIEMSDVFFQDLELPSPDRLLGVGSGTHASQTAKVMIEFEKVCQEELPDVVVVFGDVNSTIAAAITAKKLNVPVAHVEAGLRSGDWTMPEEINRRVTDAISDLLFTPSRDADKNLLKEGVPVERIHFVGNIMIDSLARAHDSAHVRRTYEKLGLDVKGYALVTLHRPSNVDDPEAWRRIFTAFEMLNGRVRIVFPLHPRTRRRLAEFGLSERLSRLPHVIISPPFGYLDFLNLEIHARFVITDSGGVQEETTWLGVPCLTLRPNTERPITIDEGTNRLVDMESLGPTALDLLAGQVRFSSRPPELWDGRSAERIARVLVEMVS